MDLLIDIPGIWSTTDVSSPHFDSSLPQYICTSIMSQENCKEPLSRGAQGISNGLVTVWAFIAAPAACTTAKLKHLVRHYSPTCCSLVLLSCACRHEACVRWAWDMGMAQGLNMNITYYYFLYIFLLSRQAGNVMITCLVLGLLLGSGCSFLWLIGRGW